MFALTLRSRSQWTHSVAPCWAAWAKEQKNFSKQNRVVILRFQLLKIH